VPAGRSRHAPYLAARAIAIAACSGNAKDGIRAPPGNSVGSPFVDIHVVATGIRPSICVIAPVIARPISGALMISGGM
jgi:hypothetical protein